jgi:PAS domain S-box-containing protein
MPSKPSNIESLHYRVLFDAAPDAILVVNAAGSILMNNAQAERLLEATPGELIGMSVEKLVPLSTRQRHIELRAGFVRTSASRPMGVGLSLYAVKLDGREFPVEISLSATEGASGKQTIVVMRDVTDRLAARRTEYELQRAKTLTKVTQVALRERNFKVLCDQIAQLLLLPMNADVVIISQKDSTGADFEIRSAYGDCAQQLLGMKLGMTEVAAELRLPILVGDLNESGKNLFPTHAKFAFRSVICAPLNDYHIGIGNISIASKTPHHFGNEDIAYIEAVTNIMSTALQRATAEQNLVKAQRLESLGQLTGGVAHDFNNLLTVISGNLQILASSLAIGSSSAKPLAAAQRASARGAELTAKLLAFARKQNLRPVAIDIQNLLEEFQELLGLTLGSNMQIQVRCEADTPTILVDPGALENALLNLAVNARDAMPDSGTLSIHASPHQVLPNSALAMQGELACGQYARIEFSDTGVGMESDILTQVFEPFFTTKAAGKGSGLGLSMVYGFAKQSSGHVSIQSQTGTGTVISLFLPTTVTPSAPKNSIHAPSITKGGGEKILVLEDNDEVREVATIFLNETGYLVVSASNIAQAKAALLVNSDIVLVFSDVMLADNETGPQACVQLKIIKPSLRILYASGYAKNTLSLTLELSGQAEFLKKPYSRNELLEAVKKAIAGPP